MIYNSLYRLLSCPTFVPRVLRQRLEEAPVDEDDHEKGDTADGCPFSQHCLEIDIASGFAVLCGLRPERGRQGGHAWTTGQYPCQKHRVRLTIQTISSPQQILHVLGHDSRDILQLGVHLVEIVGTTRRLPCSVRQRRCLCCSRVLVESSGFRNKGVCTISELRAHGS